METLFENRTALTLPLLQEAGVRYARKTHLKEMVAVGAVSVLLLAALAASIPKVGNRLDWLIVRFGVVMLTACILSTVTFKPLWDARRNAKYVFESRQKARMPMERILTFNETGFAFGDAEGYFQVYWRQCGGYTCTANLCLIYYGSSYAFVDLRGFTKGSREDFLGFLSGIFAGKDTPHNTH